MEKKKYTAKAMTALQDYPYFIVREEAGARASDNSKEMLEIKQNYLDYQQGAEFFPEGSNADYIPSTLRFKLIKTLIDKEARFIFSQSPDIIIQGYTTEEDEKKKIEQFQLLLNEVIKKNNFSKVILQSAKDCFIGKRVACLVDYSEVNGVQLHFYNALQFYYEYEYGTEVLKKFVSFEIVQQSTTAKQRLYMVNRYHKENGVVYLSSMVINGSREVLETMIVNQPTELRYIPAVVIVNSGTLEDKRGISEVESLTESESIYSKLSNADVDAERKGMNPIRYVVDMNTQTTQNLSSSAGSFWELKSEQNQNEVHPLIGTLSPSMEHTIPVKETLSRIKTTMYNELDVPELSQDSLKGMITSGKTLKALYYPLKVRCDEKLKIWKPALEQIVNSIIDIAILNKENAMSLYKLGALEDIPYKVKIQENYAILEDTEEERNSDLQEVLGNTRSRKSYLKKWRSEELDTDSKLDEELTQIAVENNMLDSLGVPIIEGEINRRETQRQIDEL